MPLAMQLEFGEKFERLTVIKRVENSKSGRTQWLCQCSCGNKIIVTGKNLKTKHTKSCGCLKLEKLRTNNIVHRLTDTKLYKIWIGIKKRCYNKNFKYYNYYGGRGITMCEDWLNNPKSFYDWAMANGYVENENKNILTIDRIDTEGNYEPNNCRFVDMKTQNRNRRSNHLITYNGETHCIEKWSEILGIKGYIIHNRLHKKKWCVEKIFETPVKVIIKRKK